MERVTIKTAPFEADVRASFAIAALPDRGEGSPYWFGVQHARDGQEPHPIMINQYGMIDCHLIKEDRDEYDAGYRFGQGRPGAAYLADTSEFCRTCGGSGTERYEHMHAPTEIFTCDSCGGSGSRSVRVS